MIKTMCHCGTVSVELSRRPRSVTECNCSICRRYGARWAYYSRRALTICSPPDSLQSYARGRRLYFDHCRNCGCVLLYRPRLSVGSADRLGINMRMVEDPAMLANIKVLRFDGAKRWKDVGTHVLRRPAW